MDFMTAAERARAEIEKYHRIEMVRVRETHSADLAGMLANYVTPLNDGSPESHEQKRIVSQALVGLLASGGERDYEPYLSDIDNQDQRDSEERSRQRRDAVFGEFVTRLSNSWVYRGLTDG